ncbi:WecB/TagA/CpsF family glycosyltransferase [Paenarthrobacter ureafaciens]|uniref:WecB/TagA/CpsF family glycosyltransferase n=1 Tax=Paenarthrobacter ureafaciens TaxID=37931 RepID=UPI0020C3A3D5|nr:WecB/TagA/CpsF family glycosyltransferase [Paenarthrobacter ureafaciens]
MLQPKPFPSWGLFHVLEARHAKASDHGIRYGTRAAQIGSSHDTTVGAEPADSPQLDLGGVPVRLLQFEDALRTILDRCVSAGTKPLAVCSANLDHIRHFGSGSRWSQTLEVPTIDWLTLIDGAPLANEAERITGAPWPRLAGSDLIGPLLDEAEERGLRVGLLGGSDDAQQMIQERFSAERPGLTVVGWWAPERPVLGAPLKSVELAAEIAACAPDILIVCLGKPRQELWIREYGHLTGAKVLLAFGAVVDFLAGRIRRAPAWVSDHSLEWAWRLMLEPRRLARRYLVDGPEAYLRLRSDSKPMTAPAVFPTSDANKPTDGNRGPAAGHTPGRFASATEQADVAVIVVTYNSAGDVGPLVASLREETTAQTIKVVVADNSPDRRTMAALAEFDDVITRSTGGNFGYAGGINAAMRAAGPADAFLILNPDLRVAPGAIAAMRRRMASSGAGVVVPVLVDYDGSIYPSLRREPGVLRALGDAALGSRMVARPGWFSEIDFDDESYQFAHRVDWATGAALLIDSMVAGRVGAWDEQFFLYSEETDYCHRVRDAGYSIWFEPAAMMWHERGGSGTSPQLTALMSVNRVRYAEKYFGTLRLAAFRAAVLAAEVARLNKPGHREAARALLTPRWRASLPHATSSKVCCVEAPPSGTVIIPAHNEAAVIARTLESLSEVMAWGTVDVIVACNGCTDGTEAIAERFAGVRVLRVEAASKAAALNAADSVAHQWPRLYLDADIEAGAAAVADVLGTLRKGPFLAARPAFRYDARGASPWVRSYYRARMRIPGSSQALWGAGAYALNESGHERLGTFPALTGDDYYVDGLFAADEKTVLSTEPVVVRTPRTASALLAVLCRTYRGNAEQNPSGGSPSSLRTLRQLFGSVRSPLAAADAVIYAIFAAVGRHRAFRSRTKPVAWERDNSSR